MHKTVPAHDQKAGLLYWAQRALAECGNASIAFAPDPVHDLRVAIRRCRSMADGFISIDPDRRWKQMKRLAKPLFTGLGELRDTQVMMEWITKLSRPEDQVRVVLLQTLQQREQDQRQAAQQALHVFDRKHWLELNTELTERSREVPLEGTVFQFIALERMHDARVLHRQAMRNRSSVAYHQLRIGIKRFRYTVENFLPERHERWSKDLRTLQDALGEIHDFDVLWATIRAHSDIAADERRRWRDVLMAERTKRLDIYRAKMLGSHSLWHGWESELPRGEAMEHASLEKLRTWAMFFDPSGAESDRATRFSLAMFDELARGGKVPVRADTRRVLEAAAVLHDIGRSKSEGGHARRSYRIVRRMPPPLGWTEEQMHRVAAVARYHRGKLPTLHDEELAGLASGAREEVFRLSGVLRLGVALALHSPDSAELSAHIREMTMTLNVRPMERRISRAGEHVATSKYLLEATCGISIVIETDITAGQVMNQQ